MKENYKGGLSRSSKIIHSELVMKSTDKNNLFNQDLYFYIYESYFDNVESIHLSYNSFVSFSRIEESSNGVPYGIFKNFYDEKDMKAVKDYYKGKQGALFCDPSQNFFNWKEYKKPIEIQVRKGLSLQLLVLPYFRETPCNYYQVTASCKMSFDEFKNIKYN
jgi:hypothetical protein